MYFSNDRILGGRKFGELNGAQLLRFQWIIAQIFIKLSFWMEESLVILDVKKNHSDVRNCALF
jgi:hypothetical protein